jgi:hypothetical protein
MPEIEEGAPSKAKNKTSTKPSSNGSARKGKGKGKPAPLPEQKLMYSKHDALLFLGEDALTVEQLKDYLGWEELDTPNAPGVDPDVTALYGKPVRMVHNLNNRFITPGWLLKLKSIFLNGRWRYNGHPLIIGRFGNFQDGQHRAIAAILAEAERTDPKTAHRWKEICPDPIRMETLVVFGVEETDDVFATQNEAQKGTLAESFYRSEFFNKQKPGPRKEMAKMVEVAIKRLWKRTAIVNDAVEKYLTTAAALDFASRHITLTKEVVPLIYKLNQKQEVDGREPIERPVYQAIHTVGDAAALMYLMACSATEEEVYYGVPTSSERTEKKLNWSMWDKAESFWTRLVDFSDEEFEVVRTAINRLADTENARAGSRDEVLATVVKAWKLFIADEDLTQKKLALKTKPSGDGQPMLNECPDVGGIDRGDPKEPGSQQQPSDDSPSDDTDGDDPDDVEEAGTDPTPDEIEQEVKKIKPRPRRVNTREEELTERQRIEVENAQRKKDEKANGNGKKKKGSKKPEPEPEPEKDENTQEEEDTAEPDTDGPEDPFEGIECENCDGTGVIEDEEGNQEECPACGGSGEVSEQEETAEDE